MTDTTHEAPERIWAWGHARDVCSIGEWQDLPCNHTEYVRADLVQAAVAAALREAADYAGTLQDFGREEAIEAAILRLITPDAQAALDRVVAEQREKDAKVAFDAGCGWQALRTAALSSSWPEDAAKHLASEHAAFAIAVAIRKGGE
jgi:hypothetical protein